jgi:outer membrane immunogenic protein
MKRVLLAAISAAVFAAGIQASVAADLGRRPAPMPTKAPAYYAPIYNWTGFYVGINGGGGWGDSAWTSTGGFDVSGGMVGGTVGYNYQMNQWVMGLEGDIDWSNIKGTTTSGCALGCETRNSWLGTARGRIGYAFDRFLPYVTGGAAFGDIKASTPGFAGGSATNVGWALGGGMEYAFTDNLSAKVEYLHVDLGDFNCGISCGALATDNVSFKSDIVRGGLNFKF